MSKHALTRVQFSGDRATIVAGAIPDTLAVRGLTETLVEATPVPKPGATKTIPKPTLPPARVPKAAVVAPKDAQPQAEKEKK